MNAEGTWTRGVEGGTEWAAFFLVGPTAVGKTAVADLLARQDHLAVVSADSMLVYRGMDVGTDKPAAPSRAGLSYWGLDLIDPESSFSVGDYVRHARQAFAALASAGQQAVVVGGTGLYIKCLIEGLAALPSADPAVRARAEALLQERGLPALQQLLQKQDPARYAALSDKQNPRRLVRALELAAHAAGAPRRGGARPSVPLVGLKMAPDVLYATIEVRVKRIFASGFLDEVKRLRSEYHKLSATALQAIGYREAFSCLDGLCSLDDAMASTIERTRRLAKRQMTWFRHQASVVWIDVPPSCPLEQVARQVRDEWDKYGRTPLCI